MALLATSAGLAGWVVGEELLPSVSSTPAASEASADHASGAAERGLPDDPIARLKARNASERVARLREQLAQDRSAQGLNRGGLERETVSAEPADASAAMAPSTGDDIRSDVVAVDAVPGDAVTVEEAGRVLDQLAHAELSSLPPTPADAGITVEEAAAVLDRLVTEPESALPPIPEGGTSSVDTNSVPVGAETLPPAQGVLDQLANAENESESDSVDALPTTPAEESVEAEPVSQPADQPLEEGIARDTTPVEEPLPESSSNTASGQGRSSNLEPRPVSALRFVDDPDPEVEPVRDPHQLKKLGSILPFSDYEPDGEITASDRCQNLCPRPGDGSCPDCKPGMSDDPSQISCPECPEEVALNQTEESKILRDRAFPAMDYRWEAPNLWHYPLYFEDVQLERYGHCRPWYLQPFISTARMSGQILMGPYQLALMPPWRKDYTLGNYRPGESVPYRYEQLPWNNRAAATQAGAMVGGYFLFAPTP